MPKGDFEDLFRFLWWGELCEGIRHSCNSPSPTSYSGQKKLAHMAGQLVNLYLVEAEVNGTRFSKIGLTVDDPMWRDSRVYKELICQESVSFELASCYEAFALFRASMFFSGGKDERHHIAGWPGAGEAIFARGREVEVQFRQAVERVSAYFHGGGTIRNYAFEGYVYSLLLFGVPSAHDGNLSIKYRTPYLVRDFGDVLEERGITRDPDKLARRLASWISPIRQKLKLTTRSKRIEWCRAHGWAVPDSR